MDAIDKKIIGVLKDNGRATNKKVAKMLGISEGSSLKDMS
jgi:DNA-binding Lrp family transcriptional regulator